MFEVGDEEVAVAGGVAELGVGEAGGLVEEGGLALFDFGKAWILGQETA